MTDKCNSCPIKNDPYALCKSGKKWMTKEQWEKVKVCKGE